MSQEVSTRVQQALEQIGEDESLTSDLTDPAATALLDWITQEITAADAAPDATAFQQRVAAIRSAARMAARLGGDEDLTAALVVERAQAALQASTADLPASEVRLAEPVVSQPPATTAPTAAAPQPSAGSDVSDRPRGWQMPPSSLWKALRRRVRRWVHRKV